MTALKQGGTRELHKIQKLLQKKTKYSESKVASQWVPFESDKWCFPVRKSRIWSHLLKKSLMEYFIFLCSECQLKVILLVLEGIFPLS